MNLRELCIVETNICSKLKTFLEECCLSICLSVCPSSHPCQSHGVQPGQAVSLLLVNSNPGHKHICTVLMYLSIYLKSISRFKLMINVQNYFLVRSTAGVNTETLYKYYFQINTRLEWFQNHCILILFRFKTAPKLCARSTWSETVKSKMCSQTNSMVCLVSSFQKSKYWTWTVLWIH